MKKHMTLGLALLLTAALAIGCSPKAETASAEPTTTEVVETTEVEAVVEGPVLTEIPEELGEYNYITAEDLKARLDAGDLESGKLIITTSQTEEELAVSYLKGDTIKTKARPLKTVEDYAKLEPAYDIIKDSDADVITICPRGKSGATRPYDYFVKRGISADRIFILEGGQENFTKQYPDYVVIGNQE